jgi:hypothetical protein
VPEPEKPAEAPEAPQSAPSQPVVSTQPGVAPPAEPDPAADAAEAEPSMLSDERTDRAVEDIVAHESDELLKAQDTAAANAPTVVVHRKRGFWRGIGHFFGLWFGTAKGRWLTFIFLVLIGGSVAAVPEARYWTLNTAGVRASASVGVVDEITQLPLKGVTVTLAGQTKQTGTDGTARFTRLRLGETRLGITQPGFASIYRRATMGWGSNPLGLVSLDATGARYTITVSDYITGKPLSGVLATAGDATAQSDDAGKIELTLEDATAAGLSVSLSRDGYRSAQVALKAAAQTTAAQLLPARKTVYVSKASGKYDLYKSDLDGTNPELLLPGTGNENANISVVTSVDGAYAAVVSTRDDQRDADGFLLNTLTLVKVDGGTTVTLAHAAQIQLIDWVGSRLIFEQVSTDPKVPVTSRYSIISYDYQANSRVQLAAAPKLTGIFGAQGDVYYAIAADDNNTSSQKPGFYSIRPDGTGRHTAYDHEVWDGVRTDYNTLALQTADGWVAYDLTSGDANAIDAPASYTSRLYRDNAEHTQSLWANQDALMLFDAKSGKDTSLQSQSGLSYPLQWVGDAVVYRVVTGGESANYITALTPGATAHKILDVANTYGFSTGQ